MIIHNLKVELLNNDISTKLTQILNELNLTFTVDNLSKVLELIFIMYVEDLTIDASIKLVEQLKYEDIFEGQDISATLKIMQNLMFQITQEDITLSSHFDCIDKLKYEDTLEILLQASMKLVEKLKYEMVHEDFEIYIAGGLNISVMRPVVDLKSLTIGSMKTMTLWNFYYVDN